LGGEIEVSEAFSSPGISERTEKVREMTRDLLIHRRKLAVLGQEARNRRRLV